MRLIVSYDTKEEEALELLNDFFVKNGMRIIKAPANIEIFYTEKMKNYYQKTSDKFVEHNISEPSDWEVFFGFVKRKEVLPFDFVESAKNVDNRKQRFLRTERIGKGGYIVKQRNSIG